MPEGQIGTGSPVAVVSGQDGAKLQGLHGEEGGGDQRVGEGWIENRAERGAGRGRYGNVGTLHNCRNCRKRDVAPRFEGWLGVNCLFDAAGCGGAGGGKVGWGEVGGGGKENVSKKYSEISEFSKQQTLTRTSFSTSPPPSTPPLQHLHLQPTLL